MPHNQPVPHNHQVPHAGWAEGRQLGAWCTKKMPFQSRIPESLLASQAPAPQDGGQRPAKPLSPGVNGSVAGTVTCSLSQGLL